MPWCIFDGPGQGSFFVGGHEDAVHWAAHHAHSVINCADVDYPHAKSCRRRWLNINYRGSLNGRDWNQRLRAVLIFLVECLVRKDCVLIHCRVGRHRSGLFAVVALMLVLGLSWDEACDVYFEKRIGLSHHDRNTVRCHRMKKDLLAALARLQQAGFCDDLLEQLRRPPPPRPPPPPSPPPMPPPPSPAVVTPRGTVAKAMPKRSAPRGTTVAKAMPKARPPPEPTPKAKARPRYSSGVLASSNSDVPARSSAGSGVYIAPTAKSMPKRSSGVLASSNSDVPARSSAGSGVPGPSEGYVVVVRSRSPARSRSRSRSRSILTLQSVRLVPNSSAGSVVLVRSRSPSRSRSGSPQNWDFERAWQCPRCESMNHRSFMFCSSWDCRRSRPLLQRWLPGDWFCFACGNHNYRRRSNCNNPHCETMQFKPGDWHCPVCRNHNFAARRVCNTKYCRARRT